MPLSPEPAKRTRLPIEKEIGFDFMAYTPLVVIGLGFAPIKKPGACNSPGCSIITRCRDGNEQITAKGEEKSFFDSVFPI